MNGPNPQIVRIEEFSEEHPIHHYRPETQLLENQVVLLTGVGNELGQLLARHYAACGARMVLTSRHAKVLHHLKNTFETEGFLEPLTHLFNPQQADANAYFDLKQHIENGLGRLDGIVHQAAYLHGLTPLENFPAMEWFKTIHTNLNAPFLLTQTLLPLLKHSNNAHVIFTSCEAAKGKTPYFGAYAAAKAGMECLTSLLAEELAPNFPNIRVRALQLPFFNSAQHRKHFPGVDHSTLLAPEKCVPWYLYLSSECFLSGHDA